MGTARWLNGGDLGSAGSVAWFPLTPRLFGLPMAPPVMDTSFLHGYALPAMNWPPHLPDGCPPPDALDASGVVYRLVRGDCPTESDFLPKVLEEPDGEYQGRECQAAGLSVFRKRKDLDRLLSYPSFRNRTLCGAGPAVTCARQTKAHTAEEDPELSSHLVVAGWCRTRQRLRIGRP